MQNLIYDTQNPKEIEDWKEERDNYIREREKYIALSNLKVLSEQMSPCMSKSNLQCSFFCKNYYNCKGDKNGKN